MINYGLIYFFLIPTDRKEMFPRCCFCGPVKNVAPFILKVLNQVEKMASLFEDYEIFLYYDHSTDTTLEQLKAYQTINPKLSFYVNMRPYSAFRTHNLANARNNCLEYIYSKGFPWFVMMDWDDVNAKEVNLDVLKSVLEDQDKWDAVSFQTAPTYKDIWALSIYPYCFSYNHFNKSEEQYYVMQDFVTKKLQKLNKGEYLPCISAFNGLAIYKTNKFYKIKYVGHPYSGTIPKGHIQAHAKAANSKLVYPVLGGGWVNAKVEDCEHRAFHARAISIHEARIRICPEVLME